MGRAGSHCGSGLGLSLVRHIAEAHGSFELEEMIEDVLEDVPESEAG